MWILENATSWSGPYKLPARELGSVFSSLSPSASCRSSDFFQQLPFHCPFLSMTLMASRLPMDRTFLFDSLSWLAKIPLTMRVLCLWKSCSMKKLHNFKLAWHWNKITALVFFIIVIIYSLERQRERESEWSLTYWFTPQTPAKAEAGQGPRLGVGKAVCRDLLLLAIINHLQALQ